VAAAVRARRAGGGDGACLGHRLGEFETIKSLLGAEVGRRFPDLAPFLEEIESIDSWQSKIAAFLDRMEKTSMAARKIGEAEILYDAPSPRHKLRVRAMNGATSINFDGYRYLYNAVLPKSFAQPRNFATMLRDGRVAWSNEPGEGPKPVKLTVEPLKGNPKVEIIIVGAGLDEVASLKATYHDMIRKCGNNSAAARDLIIGDRAGNDLYMRASKIDYDKQRRSGVLAVKSVWDRITP
jgi:hypothetical protein